MQPAYYSPYAKILGTLPPTSRFSLSLNRTGHVMKVRTYPGTGCATSLRAPHLPSERMISRSQLNNADDNTHFRPPKNPNVPIFSILEPEIVKNGGQWSSLSPQYGYASVWPSSSWSAGCWLDASASQNGILV